MGMIIENELQRSGYSTELSLGELKRIIHYEPSTGDLIWLQPISYRIKPQTFAGWWSGTYFRVNVKGTSYYLHVLAWFYMTGIWTLVDHRDRNTTNNKFYNLREANRQQNTWNQGTRVTNLLGIKGVQQRGSKFRAYITVNYKTLHLGTYESIEEAINARQNAEQEYFGEFANG